MWWAGLARLCWKGSCEYSSAGDVQWKAPPAVLSVTIMRAHKVHFVVTPLVPASAAEILVVHRGVPQVLHPQIHQHVSADFRLQAQPCTWQTMSHEPAETSALCPPVVCRLAVNARPAPLCTPTAFSCLRSTGPHKHMGTKCVTATWGLTQTSAPPAKSRGHREWIQVAALPLPGSPDQRLRPPRESFRDCWV